MATAPPASRKKVRYAVVGLGHIAQAAVLPAFSHARNSQLAALVSGDPTKLQELAAKYQVAHTYSYEEFDRCLASGEIDAVYIALPNSMHCEYSVRAALADLRVIEAIFESADSGRSMPLAEFQKTRRPSIEQELDYPPVREPELVHVENPAL